MKIRLFAAAAAVILAGCAANAIRTSQRHRVVMDVSSDNPKVWEIVTNNVENLQKAFGGETASIEVVAYGPGLGMRLGSDSALTSRLQALASSGVVLAACENTMRRKGVQRSDLLPFATTVESGVAEVVRKQEQGWSYVKSGS